MKRYFSDKIEYSPTEKTAISVRDGILEYLGSEIGESPEDKIFTVYRSPATIGNASILMAGIPLTNEHVSLDEAPPETGNTVLDSILIDMSDGITGARIGVKNKLSISDDMIKVLDMKKQLSLGYSADLVPHNEYDFEQTNIQPHHLAVVENGRCGQLCCFLDKKTITKGVTTMAKKKKYFYDEEGNVSLEQVVEIATSLPEAIKKVPVDRLSDLMGPLMEIMSYAKEQGVMPEDPEIEVEGEVMEETTENLEDEEMEKEKEKEFTDSVNKRARKLADAEIKKYAKVIGKAKDFLDYDYDFSSKTANRIMRDALGTQYNEKDFEDSELSTAFKLLKKSAPDYSNFGDSAMPSGLEKRIENSMKEK